MKKKSFIVGAFLIWAFSVGSLLGVRYYVHKKPNPGRFMAKAHAVFQSLDNGDKTNIAHYESAMLRLDDDSVHLIGLGYEAEENRLLTEKRVSIKKIEFRIDDRILLERRLMAAEVFKTLNNAERKCLEDGFASIIFRNGDYYLLLDSKKYPEYVKKYGKECKSCEELKKNSANK